MIVKPFHKPHLRSKLITAAFASGTVLAVAGCSNMATTAPIVPETKAASLSGHIHGGNQPVQFATVYLYAAGESGYGSAATLLATTSTDVNGNFGFNQQASGGPYPSSGNTYTCSGLPLNPPLLYIRAKGGNTQATGDPAVTNSAAAFLAPLGGCPQVSDSTNVDITEVTTAASAAALAQYINPATEDIGTDGILLAEVALANSMKVVGNLVNQGSGTANTTVTIPGSGNGVSGVTVTATPESSKLNTVADILSSCVNQTTANDPSAKNCSTLFANATPPTAANTSQPGATFATATDVLQAALYMFLNPTDSSTTNLSNLFSLTPASGAPYQPTLTSAPTDWTVGIAYSSTSHCSGSTSPFFASPYDLNLDLEGNVWLVNNNANGGLVELSSIGTPSACVPLASSSTAGGVEDTAGNIWYTATSGDVYRYTPGTQAVRDYSASVTGFLGTPQGITVDGSGNIFFSTSDGTTGYVYEIDNGATIDGVNPPSEISNFVGAAPARLFPDTTGSIWVSSGSNYVSRIRGATSGAHFLNNFNTVHFAVPTPSYGIITDANGNIYVSSQDPGASLTVLGPANATYSVLAQFPTAANAGGLSNPAGLWIDGADNSWIANSAAESNGFDALSVIAFSGSAVSPTGSPNGNSNGGYEKSATYFNGLRNVTIDPSGNVWSTSDNNAGSVTELVGAAVPIVNPYSYGLQNVQSGRFQAIP